MLAGFSVYYVSVLCIVGLPVSLLMKDNVDAGFALISLFVFFATSLTICLVFVPKVHMHVVDFVFWQFATQLFSSYSSMPCNTALNIWILFGPNK